MPINSKYSDQKIEQILAEIAAVLKSMMQILIWA